MRLMITKSYEELSKLAAENVTNIVEEKPNAVLGLPTGSTPIGMYKKLISMYSDGTLSFRDVTAFNLDEYEGLDKNSPNSYYKYMLDNFYGHIDIAKDKTNIPDGKAVDIYNTCIEYEERIKKAGGIDLIILGLGNNGHIGFNEPADHFSGITHRVKLHRETIKANSRFFNSIDEVPKYAITMGIRSIMHCKKIILLASGKAKAEAIKKALKEPVTAKVPASVLQLHQDLTVIIDEEAASLL